MGWWRKLLRRDENNSCRHCWHFVRSEDHVYDAVPPCERRLSNYSDKYTCCHCDEVKWVKDGGGW